MAFEGLTEKLTSVFNKLRGKGHLSEADVKEAMREIRLALLEADVSYKVVKDFIKTVTDRAIGEDILASLTPAQMVIKIVNEEMTALMGGEAAQLNYADTPPTVIMMVGLQGAGKTTNAAKLANFLRGKKSRRPLLVACDVYRPAAIKQLEVVGAQLDIPVFQMGQIDPVTIAKEAVAHAKKHGNDLVFLDTAGRLHVDEELMDELRNIKAAVNPNEILLVVDAMIGQDAVNAASAFDEALDITGVMLTTLRSLSRPSPASPSSSSAWARSWTPLRSSTLTGWPAASWAWAMCSPSSKRHRPPSMRKRPRSWSKRSARTGSPSRISTIRSRPLRRWGRWVTFWASSRG